MSGAPEVSGAEPQSAVGAGLDLAAPELPGGFSQRALTWGIGVATASFTLAILWSAFGDSWLGGPRTVAPSTFSVSALGHEAAARFLREAGLGVSTRQSRGGAGMDKDHPLVLAEPASGDKTAPEGQRFVAAWEEAGRRGAPRLMVLPKWRGEVKADDPRWLGRVWLLPTTAPRAALALLPGPTPALAARRRLVGDCRASWGDGAHFAVDLRHAQLLAPAAGLEGEVACSGGLLVARLAAGPAAEPATFVLADPDVLNNQGLGRADHAALLYSLLATRMAAHGAVFDETIHGFYREPGLLAEALRFPLVLATLASLILGGLAVWAGSGRLGKAVPPPPAVAAGKGVLIDTTAALLSAGGHSGESLARYAKETLRDVAAASFLPADLPDRERVERLARLAATRGVAVDLPALLARIGAVSATRGGDANALTLARQLYRFRVEMTHVARKDR